MQHECVQSRLYRAGVCRTGVCGVGLCRVDKDRASVELDLRVGDIHQMPRMYL